MSVKKRKRMGLTLSKYYLDFLEDLVWDGVYQSKSVAVMAAIRLLMKEHGAFYILEKIEKAEK